MATSSFSYLCVFGSLRHATEPPAIQRDCAVAPAMLTPAPSVVVAKGFGVVNVVQIINEYDTLVALTAAYFFEGVMASELLNFGIYVKVAYSAL